MHQQYNSATVTNKNYYTHKEKGVLWLMFVTVAELQCWCSQTWQQE